ncbi:MAG: type II secretion system protein [Gammaproteobacteria bacterium]
MRLPRLRQRGFTLLELVVVISIISTIGIVAVNRFWQWSVVAERASMQTVVGAMRTALGLETTRLALRQQLSLLPNLVGTNPMQLLAQAPANYLGEVDNKHQPVEDGRWYYDNDTQLLVYRLKYTDGFSTSLEGAPRIRYRIQLVYTDNNGNQRFDRGIDDIGGIDLVPAEAYTWQPPPP